MSYPQIKYSIKKFIKDIPFVGRIAQKVSTHFSAKKISFQNSTDYWIKRYSQGGNSGDGSYDELAIFKSEVLNLFVQENKINTVIEHGTGDGNQLRYANYPHYLGFDVSPTAVELCQKIFNNDDTKQFKLSLNYNSEKAELALSLDVIYHLVEDEVFESYMQRLFDSALKFVIIYSSNSDVWKIPAAHVKPRIFTEWIEKNRPEWKLIKIIPNKYPYKENAKVWSHADFYIYKM